MTADVVIVGARCAGAALALRLARAGRRVIVCDRAAFGADTLSTHALMRPAVLLLARWGLLDAVRDSGAPAVRRTTFLYDGDPVVVDIEPRDGVDALYAPRRTVLDALLIDAARRAGADVRFGHRVVGVERDATGAARAAEVVDMDDHHETIQAPLVVGADGLHSTVARQLGLDATPTGRHAVAVVYAHWPELVADGYRWYFCDGLSAGVIPTNGGACVFVAVPPSSFRPRFHGRMAEGFREVLARVAPDIVDQTQGLPPEGFRGFGGVAGQTRPGAGAGWALAGDARNFRDPLTAHGITDALLDADRLADAILDGSPGALRAYDHDRRAEAAPIQELSDRIASFDWSLDDLRDLHRRLSRAMGREARGVLAAR